MKTVVLPQVAIVAEAVLRERLIDELAARGIVFAIARRKHTVRRLFEASWVDVRRELTDEHNYPTLTSAVNAFNTRSERDATSQVRSVP